MKHIGNAVSHVQTLCEALEPRLLLDGGVMISEFMALNTTALTDGDGQYSDWLELHNPTDATVDLTGWQLKDSAEEWTFPATSLGPGEFLVVFASDGREAVLDPAKDPFLDPAGYMHTNFKLKGSGEYLGLLNDIGVVVHEYDEYPEQFLNISYGIAQDVNTTEYVAGGAEASYLVPTGPVAADWMDAGFVETGWSTGDTGLGFSDLVSGFAVRNYKASVDVVDLNTALQVVSNPAMQSYVNSANAPVINYLNSAGSGHYVGDVNYPGFTSSQDDFVIEATGFVTIPSAGQWSFGVNSDDGFSLELDNGVDSFSMSYPGLRGTSDTIATFTFTQAGPCALRLVQFEHLQGASGELFAAQGAYGAFSAGAFDLVGDTANGGLAVFSVPISGGGGGGAFADLVETDVEAVMKGTNASMLIRIPFTVADPSLVESLTLKMKYDDGYVAYLNGEPIVGAAKNAPATPAWNSAATAQRNTAQATTWENVAVTDPADMLVSGTNVLAIHAMNFGVSDGDFLVLPELVEIAYAGLGEHYFATASPAEGNGEEYWLHVEDTTFDNDRGFYDAPFDVVISTITEGAAIRYTTDGSAPTESHGTLFDPATPIHITGTTTLRAAAFKANYSPTNVDTHTYLFLDDVVTQSANGSAPGGDWPTSDVNGQRIDYGMDPDIVGGYNTVDEVKASLLSIPTISMVTDLAHLFNSSTGIIVNANMDGRAWERPASIELIYPEGATGPGFPDGADDGFQVDAGVRIRGGYSRQDSNPKHAFRLFFRSEYGDASLKYPLFGDEGADEFNKVDLRTSQNYSWAFGGPNNNTMVREIVSRDMQGDMGQQYERGRYYHLYIDGVYWGVFQTDERPEANFGATYYGGTPDDYDVIKPEDNRRVFATDGNLAAYNRLWTATTTYGYADMTNYYRVQGLNTDGTRNEAYERLLDVDNIIDYMIITYYTGDRDGPGSWYTMGGSGPNNFFAIYNREDPDGFKFFEHDSEHSLGTGENNMVLRNGQLLEDWSSIAGLQDRFAPHWLHEQLVDNPDYVRRFSDRMFEVFYNGGELDYAESLARINYRADQVDVAMIAESARWGDMKSGTPRNHADWATDVNEIRSWIVGRTDTVVNQVKSVGWYPTAAPSAYRINGSAQHGGTIQFGDTLTITAPSGTIYYTTDGTDPMDPTSRTVYSGPIVLNESTHVRSRVLNGGVWSPLNKTTFYIEIAPNIRITEIMYNPADPTQAEIDQGHDNNDDFEYIEIKNTSTTDSLPLLDLRFTDAITYTFPNVTVGPGQFVILAKDPAAFGYRYSAFAGTVIGPYDAGSLNNGGERVQLDAPVGGIIHEFTYKDGWYDHTDGDGFSLTIRDPLGASGLWDVAEGWRASAALGGTPGYEDTLADPHSVIITEVLAHSDTLLYDAIELHNTSSSPVDISGWFFSDDKKDDLGNQTLTKYQIPAMAPLAPGAYVVFYEHTSFGLGPNAFALSELGDEVYLTSNASGAPGGYREHVDFGASPADTSIGLFTKSTGGTDFTLLSAPTLGADNAAPYLDDLAINEVMYHPAAPTPGEMAAGFLNDDDFEFIEIYNTSTTASRTLSEFYVGNGVGFTFGWYDADGLGRESWTLEPGATATWNATLPAGAADYEVFARWDLLDGEGDKRDLDGQAKYAITHSGGTANVIRDQKPELDDEGPDYIDAQGWVSLGTYTFDAAGRVVLTRGTNNPGNWTIADQVKFVSAGHTELVDAPTLDSWYTANGPATIGPGQYVVIVQNRDAFDARYDIAGNSIPVVGQYTGRLANGGDKVKLMRRGNPEPAPSHFVPYYRVDYVNYNDKLPWPVEPDGTGPSLNRNDQAVPYPYGNDAGNWLASATQGSPGQVNIFVDTTPPTVPDNVAATVALTPTRIELTWDASVDPGSSVDHYVIYRDSRELATTVTPGYVDNDVTLVTPYDYAISAVNRDARQSDRSTVVNITIPGIASSGTPIDTQIKLVFSEPLVQAPAELLANYTFTGGTLLGAALEPDGTTVLLTTAQLVAGQTYTLTVAALDTVSGLLMPAGQQVVFDYSPNGEGYMLREWWTGISGNDVGLLLASPNYPDNPAGWNLPTSFEAPTNWADNYGTRMRGYVHPPESGNYTFWIASDDASELWLSTDDDPANAVRIAWVNTWTNSREWTREANQQSVAITLSAGQRYYIEARQKEGTGGDNLAVRWQLPTGAWEDPGNPNEPIPGVRLSPFITESMDLTPPTTPGNVSALVVNSEQIDVTWTAAADSDSGIDHYVVYRNGIQIATRGPAVLTYTDTNFDQAQTYTYGVSAVNGGTLEGDAGEALPVNAPPGIESVTAVNQAQVLVAFGEPVTQATAEVLANYAITFGAAQSLGISTATWNAANPETVALTPLGFLVEGTTYTLTVNGVQDATGNTIAADTTVPFVFTDAWAFSSGTDGFTYADRAFGTNRPDFAAGNYLPGGGDAGGGLQVFLGPGRTWGATSGAWSRTFQVSTTGVSEVSLRYRIILGSGYENREFGEAILQIDSTRYGTAANNSLIHVAGNGNGGGNMDSGWRTATFDVPLTAGQHTITIGAFNNGGSAGDEWTDVRFDTVAISEGNHAPIVVNPIPRVDVGEDAGDTVVNLADVFDDADPGDTLTLSVAGNTKASMVTTSMAGTDLRLSYLADQYGQADITVRATDLAGAWVEETFIVAVAPVSDDPIAHDDDKDAFENTPLVFPASDLLANDIDVDYAGMTVDVVTATADTHGTVDLVGGIVTYTSEIGYFGPASFTYVARDADGSTDTATVNVTVTDINQPPVANDDDKETIEEQSLVFPAADLAVNDTDVDSPTLTVTAVAATADTHGLVALVDGTITYTPDANHFGPASFDYTVSDGDGGTDTGAVNVAIAGTFDDPVAADDDMDTIEDAPLIFAAADLLANDDDDDDAGLTVTGVAATADTHGLVALLDGTVTYTPDDQYSGPASFTYTIESGNGGSDTATVNVNVANINDDPTAVDDDMATPQGTSLFFPAADLLVNDTDIDSTVLTVVAVGITPDTHGLAALLDGMVVYSPTAGYSGFASFTYTVSDGDGGEGTGTVNVAVGIAGSAAPSGVDLLPAFDTGADDTDNVTNIDNHAPGAALRFEVAGTIAGATVTVYAGGIEIGSAVAGATTTIVTTTGAADLADGVHVIAARQIEPGKTTSPDSPVLSLTVDTDAPTTSVPDLAAASDTGPSDTDNITDGIDPQFDGTVSDAGSGVWKVEVASDDGKSATDGAAPFYTVTLATLDEGERTVTATAYDVAGNTVTTAGLAVTVQRTPTTLTWDGTDGAEWASAHWDLGPVAPGGGEAMVVDSGRVTVSSDLTTTPGAAASLAVADGAEDGFVDINAAGALSVTGEVTVSAGGILNIDGTLAAADVNITGGSLTNSRGSAAAVTVNGDVTLAGGATFVTDLLNTGVDTLVTSGAVTIGPNASLEITPAGGNVEFRAGTYTLVQAAGGLSGTFANVTGLGGYVSVNGNGLTYDDVAGTVTLTIDKNLNPADGNLDGATDVSDRIIWNNNNFTFGTTFATGDYNGDGQTDVSDRIVWNNNNFTFATGPAPAPPAAMQAPGDADSDALTAVRPDMPTDAPPSAATDSGDYALPADVQSPLGDVSTTAPPLQSPPPASSQPPAIDDADAPAESQLEPDLSSPLTDPLQ